jgi:hypothetical protein
MKNCPYCDKKFNWWQRAVGEDKEHIRHCCHTVQSKNDSSLAATCRGCPANCFEGVFHNEEKQK